MLNKNAIYVQKNGQQLGPYSLHELKEYLACGSLDSADPAWCEGASGWILTSELLKQLEPATAQLAESSAASIHIQSNGSQYGPYTQEQIKEYLANGSLNSADLAWCEGMDAWQPLYSLSDTLPLGHQLPSTSQINISDSRNNNTPKVGEVILHEMKQNQLARFSKLMPQNSKPVLACKLSFDATWLFFGIPLWFNLHWHYLIFTDTCIAIGHRTLWSGYKELTYYGYEEIQWLLFKEEKGLGFCNRYFASIYAVGIVDPIHKIELRKKTFVFLVGNSSKLKQFHNGIKIHGPA